MTAVEAVLTADQIAAVHRVRAEIVAYGETNSVGGPSCGVLSEELGMLLGGRENYGRYRLDDGTVCDDHAWVQLPGGVILDASADQFDGGAPIRVLSPGDPDFARYL